MARLKQHYREKIVPGLVEKFGYSSVMAVPRIEKITLNMGVGEAVGDKKILQNAMEDMEKIAGQKPIITKARKSVAGFKIREGWPIGRHPGDGASRRLVRPNRRYRGRNQCAGLQRR